MKFCFFFFQAEDGIRDYKVTGVQTCALPIWIITVHITKAEMGQGVGTALAQIVAEELEADWKDVRIDYPMNDPKYGLMLTGGSWSVNWTFDSLSRAEIGRASCRERV